MLKVNYFNGRLSSGFVSLFSGRMFQFIGSGLIGIFLPIYLFKVFGLDINLVIFFYLAAHLFYALFLPLGARWINQIGLNNSLRISVFLFALYYLCLYLVKYDVFTFILIALIVLTLTRTLFWMPYHTDLAIYTDRRDRGKSIGLLWATSTFLGVVMPLIAGFLIGNYGYGLVFILAIAIHTSSIIPFLTLPPTQETYSWRYFETFKHIFDKKNRKLVLANMANGAENEIGVVIWPIFIWQLLQGNYFAVGAISSLIVLATISVQLGVGKYTDIFDKRKMIRWGSVLYASGWLAKVFVLSSFQIFVIGTYHSFTQIFKDTPFDTLNYELIADQGHYVDEYTVIKELAVQIGKVLMLIFVLLLLVNFGLNWTFALAALASLFINFL
ncbi:MAG: Major Facilitator Superfamily protein [Parcubacteria group bacterium ADurb.Bin316]|nr:MAG: Major Facilitator Superfamily protein [Parcubacteria group bacterium ADurb.Bin316]HOZ56147.1 MFS transporter [bacterium]